MSVEVVIPWRAGCSHRVAARRWVINRYADIYPAWRVTIAEATEGPWVKALAVTPAVEASVADVIVLADADCWTPGLTDAVAAVKDGAPWAIPHMNVYRLTEAGTAATLAGAVWENQPLDRPPYNGLEGGGFVVAPREILLDVPLDPRFIGWGQEDMAHGVALRSLAGKPRRGKWPLVHLYHPPQARLDRKRGSVAGVALCRRYAAARRDPARMRALLEEVSP